MGAHRHDEERIALGVEAGAGERADVGAVAVVGGTGAVGFGLALRLGLAGLSVHLGSRDRVRAEEATARANEIIGRPAAIGGTNTEAVAAAGRLVVLAVPFTSQLPILKSLREAWRPDQVVLDATVPLAASVGGRPTQLLAPWQGSAAQQARSAIPAAVAVVSGLHTVSAAALNDIDNRLDQDTLLCGDSAAAKRLVAAVLGRIGGLRAVDAGGLEMSRLVEGITPILIGVNIRNKTHAGIRLTRLGDPAPLPVS